MVVDLHDIEVDLPTWSFLSLRPSTSRSKYAETQFFLLWSLDGIGTAILKLGKSTTLLGAVLRSILTPKMTRGPNQRIA